jgi:MGT family glycosyltransferase
MAKILVTTLPHEGHLNPTFGIANELRNRGHDIAYLGHPIIDEKIRIQKFPILKNRKMGVADIGFLLVMLILQKSRGEREMKMAMRLFTTRLKPQVQHINYLIDSYHPDIIINDAFHYAGALASEIKNLPWVDCWTAGMMHPESKPYLSPVPKHRVNKLLSFFDLRINKIRKNLNLSSKPAGSFLKPSPWLQLYTSCPEIEPTTPDLGVTAECIGPCISKRKEQAINIEDMFDEKLNQYPLVYVSFGTFFNRNKKSVKKLILASEKLKIRMLISTPLINLKQHISKTQNNVVLISRAPQRHVLNKAKLFITHGGNNSVQEALAAGVPMLVTPVAGEQQYNANRVRWLGVGDLIDVTCNSSDEIKNKIKAAIENEEYIKKISLIQKQLKKYNAPVKAANLIEEILANNQAQNG